ncbi:MAG: hypothetical protein ACETVY_06885 [Candidatus Bathyarchaeia archaeon]
MGHKDIEERKKTFATYQINDETLPWASRTPSSCNVSPATGVKR